MTAGPRLCTETLPGVVPGVREEKMNDTDAAGLKAVLDSISELLSTGATPASQKIFVLDGARAMAAEASALAMRTGNASALAAAEVIREVCEQAATELRKAKP